MKFRYEAYDAGGSRRSGNVEAAGEGAAVRQLAAEGLFVASIAPDDDAAPTLTEDPRTADRGRPGQAGRPAPAAGLTARPADVASLTRELSVLVSTGVRVADALRAIERQCRDDNWRRVVGALAGRVEQGTQLSEALAEHPRYFDPVARSLVAAGEESGELDTMLVRLAALSRQQLAARKALVGAMVYPVSLMVLASASVVVILTTVVPRFSGMFESLDAPLPPTTELLVFVGTALVSYWYAFAGGLAAVIAGFWAWSRGPAGRARRDRALLRAPIFGPLIRRLAVARAGRLLGTLLTARTSLVIALELVRDAMTNHEYRLLIEDARNRVIAGEPLAAALNDERLVPPAFGEAVRNGELTGRLGEVLSNLSDHFDEDNRQALQGLSKSLEPIIVGVMGLVIAFLALSMFLPLFDLAASTGGG